MAIKFWIVRLFVFTMAMAFLVACSAGEVSTRISVVEGVAIKNHNRDEAIFYYENNWLEFRKDALRLGYIDAYELVTSNIGDEEAGIVLITHFKSEAQFEEIEANFEKIMQDRQLQLLNDVEPADFRQSVFVVTGENSWNGGA